MTQPNTTIDTASERRAARPTTRLTSPMSVKRQLRQLDTTRKRTSRREQDTPTGERIDLSAYLVRSPESTFCIRVAGDCMRPHIQDGDLLVIDRSPAARAETS